MGTIDPIDREIIELIHRLPELQQQLILDFVRELAEIKPTRGTRSQPDSIRRLHPAG